METYTRYVVAYDEDLDIAKREIIFGMFDLWIFAKNNNIGIWNCIMYLQECVTHLRIKCEFMGNETREDQGQMNSWIKSF